MGRHFDTKLAEIKQALAILEKLHNDEVNYNLALQKRLRELEPQPQSFEEVLAYRHKLFLQKKKALIPDFTNVVILN